MVSCKRVLTSFFGLGFLPLAPGSWGSLPVPIIFGLCASLGVTTAAISVVRAALIVVASVVCVSFSSSAIEACGRKDPGEVVVDEVAGQAVAFLMLPCLDSTVAIWTAAAIGFVAFRVFDIIKPPPCRQLENLPDGWGILADDLAAGVYAAITLQLCLRFLPVGCKLV